MSTQLPRELLPESLLTIAEHCNDDIMWKIWELYGGGRLHVPLSVTEDHTLSRLLGYRDACLLCEQFGGEQLTIAKAEAAKRAVRNALIRQGKRNGLSNLTLARQFKLTDRQVMTICNDDQPAFSNLDLFNTDFITTETIQ